MKFCNPATVHGIKTVKYINQVYKLDLEDAEAPKISNIWCIMEKARTFQKLFSPLLIIWMLLTMLSTNCRWFLKIWVCWVHLIYLLNHSPIDQEATEQNMEQLNGSELGKECSKVVYCHLIYLTFMKTISWKKLG